MKISRMFRKILTVLLVAAAVFGCIRLADFLRIPRDVRELKKRELVLEEGGHQEYYFNLLTETDKRAYREILEGIRNRKDQFYVTIAGGEQIDRVYHAVLKDHPELFWVHNRNPVYRTVYPSGGYCRLSPGYTYTAEETEQITASIENTYAEVCRLIPEDADPYETVKAVYTYLIDKVEYRVCEDDQSIAGAFWRKEAVCAGYAGAMQYLLERLGIPCIYVEGTSRRENEGHAWNIVELDGDYYYVDVTNGDQPEFLEGEAASLEEHKTIIYDYLCPFPTEYESIYMRSPEFPVPVCSGTDKNFYVMNQACFDTYDWDSVYELCRLRLDNGAAVIRFKFSREEEFRAAYRDCIENEKIQQAAGYYMDLYGLEKVSYHYGILENLKTMYFMF